MRLPPVLSCAAALLAGAAPTASSAQAPAAAAVRPHDPSLAERAQVAASAYHAIRRYFAHAEGLPAGFDFEARYRAYLDEALAAPDRAAFSRASMRFFASLRNGHTGFNDDLLLRDAAPMPFTILPVEGKWTVVRSQLAGLAPGDVVATVDGVATADWLRPIAEQIGASNRAALDRVTWGYGFLFPGRFTLGLDGGRRVAVDRTRPAAAAPAAEEVTSTRRPDGVTVIRIPSFGDRRHEAAAAEAIRATPATAPILLDLRDNGGGTTPGRLLAAIMTARYRDTSFVSPMTLAVSDASQSFSDPGPALPQLMMRSGSDTTEPRADAWAGKIALLVDGGCASACEDLALRFRDGKRGLILGEATFGSTGQPYFARFPQLGMWFRVSAKREYLPDGGQFEGVGVVPDRVIARTRASLLRGTDEQLEDAVRTLRGR